MNTIDFRPADGSSCRCCGWASLRRNWSVRAWMRGFGGAARGGAGAGAGATMPPADYQDVFGGWKSQKGMLIDDGRTLGFEARSGRRCGRGMWPSTWAPGRGSLAMFAARAGAGRVRCAGDHGDGRLGPSGWPRGTGCPTCGSSGAMMQRNYDAGGAVDVVVGEFAGMWLLEEWRHYAAFAQVARPLAEARGPVVPRAAALPLGGGQSQAAPRTRLGPSSTRRSMGSICPRC